MRTCEGHAGPIRTLAFDESHIVTGSEDCTVRVWKVQTSECSGMVSYLPFSPPPSFPLLSFFLKGLMACPSTSRTNPPSPLFIVLARPSRYPPPSSRACVFLPGILMGHSGAVTAIAFDEAYIVSGSTDCTFRLWRMNTRSSLCVVDHDAPVTAVHFSGERILSATRKGVVRVWRLDEVISSVRGPAPDPEATFAIHSDRINAIQYDEATGVVCTASDDKTVKV